MVVHLSEAMDNHTPEEEVEEDGVMRVIPREARAVRALCLFV